MREEQILLQLEGTAESFKGTEYAKMLGDTPDKTISVKVDDEGLAYTLDTRKDGTVERKPVSRAQALKALVKAGY